MGYCITVYLVLTLVTFTSIRERIRGQFKTLNYGNYPMKKIEHAYSENSITSTKLITENNVATETRNLSHNYGNY